MMAGRKVVVKIKAAMTPKVEMLPTSLKGGASLEFKLKNPNAVVILVIKIGMKLTRMLSTMASCLSTMSIGCGEPAWIERMRCCYRQIVVSARS